MNFITELQHRNPTLFWYGWLTFIGGIICAILANKTTVQVNNISAYIKPMKFFFSVWIFALTMAWLGYELNNSTIIKYYNVTVVLVMSFELFVITWQATNGRLSHFNISKGLYATLFSLMGIAITFLVLHTGYIGLQFFKSMPNISVGYLWGIRLGILLFVIFSFQGFAMGAMLKHTVGANDGTSGVPILNWSKNYGDLRIAHFFGIHALQLLPLVGYFVFKKPSYIIGFAVLYGLWVCYTFITALRGVSLFKK